MMTKERAQEILRTPGIRISMQELDELEAFIESQRTPEEKVDHARRKAQRKYYQKHRDRLLDKAHQRYMDKKAREEATRGRFI